MLHSNCFCPEIFYVHDLAICMLFIRCLYTWDIHLCRGCYGAQMQQLSSGRYSQADDTTLVEVLHQSENFVVVNKRFDLKVNSDDENEVTVATILRRLYPATVDEHASHGFRFVNKVIQHFSV